MDGLRDRGSSGACHRGGLEHRHTRLWGLVQHSMRRVLLQVYGHVGEGRGKGVQKPVEEERGERGGKNWAFTWGDRRKLETFKSRVHWTDPRTP